MGMGIARLYVQEKFSKDAENEVSIKHTLQIYKSMLRPSGVYSQF